jgi:hypothetical protein
MIAAPLSFSVDNSAALTAAGLRGPLVTATFDGAALVLRGEGGGSLDLPLAAIDRIRIGYEENKFVGHIYQLQIWSGDDHRPLALRCLGGGDYGPAARALAAGLAEAKGMSSVERGVNMGAALFLLLGLTPFFALSLWGAWQVSGEEPWWAPPAMLAIPVPLFIWLFWRFWTWQRPRPIASLAELDQQLPPG